MRIRLLPRLFPARDCPFRSGSTVSNISAAADFELTSSSIEPLKLFNKPCLGFGAGGGCATGLCMVDAIFLPPETLSI